MDKLGTSCPDWTRARVETRLIEAFRSLPGHPVFADGSRILGAPGAAPPHLEALNWSRRFVADRGESLALLTWARCRASANSVRERYREFGWTRSAAEKARRRALARIVNGLNGEKPRLDKGTKRFGGSSAVDEPTFETEPLG